MNYKFKVGDLVVATRRNVLDEIGLVTARRPSPRKDRQPAEYTILIGGIPWKIFEYELTKVSKNSEDNFKVGDLVRVNHTGSLALVTGFASTKPSSSPERIRYTVLIDGIACILRGDTLTKVSESNEV